MARVPSGIVKQFAQQRMLVKQMFIDGQEMVVSNRRGQIRYVDSVNGSASNLGLTPTSACDKIDTAIGLCTASQGDIIVALPGHNEAVIAAGGLDLDVAGVTVYFLGEGANRAKITFSTDVGADMDVDAANITLVNPLFVSGIDALTGPIDVNAADFTIIDGEYRDAAAMAATDCVVADANADRMRILGWKFVDSTTGTQKQSNIQVAGADDVVIKDAWIVGDFGTGAIENGTAWINAYLENIYINNRNTGPVVGILLQATSSGAMRNVDIRVASGTTYLTANNDMEFFNCWGAGVDADGGQPIGAAGPFDAAAAPATGVSDRAALRAVYNSVAADGAASSTTVMPGLGRRVTKVGDISGTTDALFTVTGKNLVTMMVGEVTSVFATTTSLNIKTSTNAILITTSTQVTTAAVGTLYMVTGDPDDALNGGATPNVDVAFAKTGVVAPFMMNDDRIDQIVNGAGTGLVEWTLYYLPLEDSASITSAA